MGKLGGNVTRAILNLYTTLVRASPELIVILLVDYAVTGLVNSLVATMAIRHKPWLSRSSIADSTTNVLSREIERLK